MQAEADMQIWNQEHSKYAKIILECDENMHQQQYKKVCFALREAKQQLGAEEDGRVIDNDFNARAGFCALHLGQAEEALQFTEMVNLNNPGTLLIHTLRGWSLKEIGYEKRASVLFNYVLNQVSETNSVMDSIGAAISSQLIGSDLSLFFYEQAITQFEALENPEKKLDLIWVVQALIKKNDMSSSIKEKRQCLYKALKLTQSNLDMYINLAELFFKQGKFNLALQCYLKSIEINASGNFFRQIKVGFIYFYLGEEDHALELLGRFYNESDDIKQYFWVLQYASSINQNYKLSDFEKSYQIGLLLYHLQFLQSALLMLQRAKSYSPKNYKLCVCIYLVYRHLRQFQEAIVEIKELLVMKEHQNDVSLMIILAELYYLVGNSSQSELFLLKAIQLTPNQTFSLYKYVKFLNKENRLEESLKVIQKAISIEPKKIKLLIMKALIYSSLKDLPSAYETYEEVLKINSSLQSTKFQLSQINYVLKKYSLSFDQMANIQEGEVGYEKSLNLLIKLFISQPLELTPAQIEFADTKLRKKVSEHLLNIGEVGTKRRVQDFEEESDEEKQSNPNIESLETDKSLQNEEFEVYKQLGESDGESYEELDEMDFKANQDDNSENNIIQQTFYSVLQEGSRDKVLKTKLEARVVEINDIDEILLKSKLRQLESKAPPLKNQMNSVIKSDSPQINKLKKPISKSKNKSFLVKIPKKQALNNHNQRRTNQRTNQLKQKNKRSHHQICKKLKNDEQNSQKEISNQRKQKNKQESSNQLFTITTRSKSSNPSAFMIRNKVSKSQEREKLDFDSKRRKQTISKININKRGKLNKNKLKQKKQNSKNNSNFIITPKNPQKIIFKVKKRISKKQKNKPSMMVTRSKSRLSVKKIDKQ